MPADEFVERHRDPFLVEVAGAADDEEFSTRVRVSLDELNAIADGRKLDPNAVVHRVTFSVGMSPMPGAVTLGRAPNCDIVIGDPEVSKFHAFIKPDSSAKSGYVMADQSSRNGTQVNEVRLEPSVLVPLAPGDRIRLAYDVTLQFYPPLDFWAMLKTR